MRDERIGRGVTDDGRVEVRSRSKVWVNVWLSSGIDRSSIMFGLVKHPLDITEPVPGDHRANVCIGFETLNRRGEYRSRSKLLRTSHNHVIKFIVLGLVNEKFLDTDTVLTSVLAEGKSVEGVRARKAVEDIQNTTHPDTDVSIQISTWQDDSGVLSSKLQSQRCHVLRGSERDLATDFFRSDECDVLDDR